MLGPAGAPQLPTDHELAAEKFPVLWVSEVGVIVPVALHATLRTKHRHRAAKVGWLEVGRHHSLNNWTMADMAVEGQACSVTSSTAAWTTSMLLIFSINLKQWDDAITLIGPDVAFTASIAPKDVTSVLSPADCVAEHCIILLQMATVSFSTLSRLRRW